MHGISHICSNIPKYVISKSVEKFLRKIFKNIRLGRADRSRCENLSKFCPIVERANNLSSIYNITIIIEQLIV